jgi:hypothetical protein
LFYLIYSQAGRWMGWILSEDGEDRCWFSPPPVVTTPDSSSFVTIPCAWIDSFSPTRQLEVIQFLSLFIICIEKIKQFKKSIHLNFILIKIKIIYIYIYYLYIKIRSSNFFSSIKRFDNITSRIKVSFMLLYY